MLAVVVAILSMTVIGLPIALALDRTLRGPQLIGLAFLYGSGWIWIDLLIVPHWSIVLVAIVGLLPLLLFLRRTQDSGPRTQDAVRPHWLDIPTAVSVIGFGFFATGAALWEWDFWAIWGMKARVFLDHGGIDWRFLGSHWNAYVHPDYPLLVPFNFDFAAMLNGAWSDRWLGLMSVAWAVALLLIVRDLAARESAAIAAALVTLTVTGLAASRYPGLAEGPLIAFGSAAVLFLRRATLFDDNAAWRHGAVLLGLATNVKNEGLALFVAILIALVIVRRRDVLRLWPAAVLAAPWLILRTTHDLQTDIVGGGFHRALARLPQAGQILMFLARRLYEPWFWIALLAGLVILPGVIVWRERFVLIVTAVQLAFYTGSYFATPHEVAWHVMTSWSRLTDQIAIPITFVVFLALANYAAPRRTV
ncbi:MAG TPA: glycosyltransferase family 39 protein [Thermoanaerobaculia bacterium]|nr:glycosyltransferase family 39 protein [Thermoanaerobaculia bacterium]